MAEWVPARTDLHDDIVIVKQARALGLDAELLAYKWLRLWGWAREHSTTGFVPGVTKDDIDAVIKIPGFAEAAGRWLVWKKGGVEFPSWDKHNSNGARERKDAAERQRLSRDRHKTVTKKRDTVTETRDQSRAEQSRAGLTPRLREEQSTSGPEVPSADEVPRPAVHKALVEAGLTRFQATSTIARADRDSLTDDVLLHAAAECSEQREKGKEINSPQNYVECIVGIRESAKTKVAHARARSARDVAALRTGAPQ